MIRKICLLVVLMLSLAIQLSACAEKEAAENKYAELETLADNSLKKIQGLQGGYSSLTVEAKPWYGNTAVRFLNGEPLPSSLVRDDALVLTFEKPLTIQEVALQIQAASGVRIVVDHLPETEGSSQGQDVASLFVPADGEEVTGGRILWQGSLKKLLDQIADKYDAEWAYDGRSIKISRHIIRTYMLHALAGDLKLEGSVSAGSEGLPSQSIESKADISIWDEIQEAVNKIVEGRGSATFSPATGTITVAGTPSSLHEVERYLRLQNDLRLRRVAVDVKVLSVLLNKSNNLNFDMSVLIKGALSHHPFVYQSVTAGDTSRDISTGILRSIPAEYEADTGNAASLVVNALDAVSDRVSVVHSGTIITMSDQAAPLQVAKKRSYVASVSSSATDGATATTIEPGTIDIGMTMNILPRVISSDKVMLRLAIGITDLADLREFSTTGASVQLPEVDTTGFLQNAVLSSGETMVIAGFERESATDTEVGTGYSWNMFLGGQKGFGRARELRVLLLKAQILPEERFDILTKY